MSSQINLSAAVSTRHKEETVIFISFSHSYSCKVLIVSDNRHQQKLRAITHSRVNKLVVNVNAVIHVNSITLVSCFGFLLIRFDSNQFHSSFFFSSSSLIHTQVSPLLASLTAQ